MKTIKIAKKLFTYIVMFCLSVLTLIQILPVIAYADDNDGEGVLSGDTVLYGEFGDYITSYNDATFSKDEIFLTAKNSSANSPNKQIDDILANILNEDNSEITYEFTVADEGLYNIGITYYDLADSSLSLKVGLSIDGSSPYTELENISLSKIYENESSEIQKDELGNEIRPTEMVKQRFNEVWLESETGLYSLPFAVYLEKGKHTLTVKKVLGSLAVSQIRLGKYNTPVTYADYIENYTETADGTEIYIMEAENTYEVSHSTLAATINSTNAGMSPVSSTLRVVNSFGQSYWNSNGQWGSWKVPDNVAEGLYEISFRAKQSGTVGVSSYRTLYINGEVPFKEAENIDFPYDSKWQIKTLGDGNAYSVYLKPGDVITLEATTGLFAEVISEINSTMDELNEIYQSIIIITGTEPDDNRDYNLKSAIPTLLDDMKAVSVRIENITDNIASIMGETNTKVYFLKRFSTELNGYIENYRTIVGELGSFKEYIDSFSAQTYEFNNMPLELDCIYLSKSKADIPEANAGLKDSLIFEIKRFLYTFSSEYNADSLVEKNSITVWCSLGRDQAYAVKSIIENEFIADTGINVNFKMTSTSLSEAVLSGKEPDISLSVEQSVPINMALRGQALDLAPYLEQCDNEFISQIHESAWIPFQYRGGTYAIPVTQSFQMMFYREDILSKLGISLPQTWDELYYVTRELQKSNFQVGIKESDSASAGVSSAIPVFDMFLYQRGGTYFNEDFTDTEFESTAAKEAFNDLVALYRDYGLATDFNLLSRFRSGEMPIIITDYSFYQTVAATAQEISGRWGMTNIPGTMMDDGTINHTETCVVTGVMILKGAERRGVADQAFQFAKWWAEANTQLQYSTAMESIQGVAGRQLCANTKTFDSLNWTDEEKKILNSQREWVTAVNQVPGTYIINRFLSNALRSSYTSTAIDPLRQLAIQNDLINVELDRKRAEFDENN